MNLSKGKIYPNLSVISKSGPNKHFLGVYWCQPPGTQEEKDVQGTHFKGEIAT